MSNIDFSQSEFDRAYQFLKSIRQAAALFYYTKLGVSLGYCADIANMSKMDFIYFLSENGVSVFDFEN